MQIRRSALVLAVLVVAASLSVGNAQAAQRSGPRLPSACAHAKLKFSGVVGKGKPSVGPLRVKRKSRLYWATGGGAFILAIVNSAGQAVGAPVFSRKTHGSVPLAAGRYGLQPGGQVGLRWSICIAP
jgi:hypothetical protein